MRTTVYTLVLQIFLAAVIFPQSYVDLNSPFSSTVRVLYMSNTNTLFAGGDAGFFKSTDLGETWDTVLTENTRSIYIQNDSTWYVCTYGGIFRTNNSGEQWIAFGQSLPTSVVEDIAINLSSNTFFAATTLGLFKSSDEGNNWINTLNCTTSDYTNIESINDTLIFLGKTSSTSNYDNLFRSTDNGSTWEIVDLGSFRGRLYRTPGNILFLEWKFLTATRLYRSTNGGHNWLLLNDAYLTTTGFGPWTAGLNNSLIMQKHYWMNAGAYGILLLVSFNNFQTMTQYYPWLTATGTMFITSLTVNSNEDIFAGLMDGTIRKISGISLTDINDEPVNSPTQYKVSQNYPNPFNPSTKISWQTPVSGWQTLKVYDVLGNEVATLVNEYRNAGSYELEFDASKLSSGVYFYQIKAGEFIETKKMIYLK